MTFEEFEQVADPPAGHYELHHGQLILRPPRKKGHMKVQQVLLDLLSPLVRGHGFITLEFGFRPAEDDEAWQADVGFVRQDRWDADDNEYFVGAPDLVVEVLSKSNTMDEILERQDICLSNGCVAFWTVDAKRRIIMVTTPDRKTVTYGEGSSVTLPEGLEGSMVVGDVF
jgi:Uma2 family endonuclease